MPYMINLSGHIVCVNAEDVEDNQRRGSELLDPTNETHKIWLLPFTVDRPTVVKNPITYPYTQIKKKASHIAFRWTQDVPEEGGIKDHIARFQYTSRNLAKYTSLHEAQKIDWIVLNCTKDPHGIGEPDSWPEYAKTENKKQEVIRAAEEEKITNQVNRDKEERQEKRDKNRFVIGIFTIVLAAIIGALTHWFLGN